MQKTKTPKRGPVRAERHNHRQYGTPCSAAFQRERGISECSSHPAQPEPRQKNGHPPCCSSKVCNLWYGHPFLEVIFTLICPAIKRSGALFLPGIRRKSSDFNGFGVSTLNINPISWKSVTTSVIMPPQTVPGQAETHEPARQSGRPAPWPQSAASGRFIPFDRRLPAMVHPASRPRPGRAFSGLFIAGQTLFCCFQRQIALFTAPTIPPAQGYGVMPVTAEAVPFSFFLFQPLMQKLEFRRNQA